MDTVSPKALDDMLSDTRLDEVLGNYAHPCEDHASAVSRLMRERNQLTEQLGVVQDRCTSLIDESRANRRIESAPPGELHVLGHVSFERSRQDLKYGPIGAHISIASGTGSKEDRIAAALARRACDDAFSLGRGTFAHILLEEVAETMAESDPKLLRAELIQVAAVAVKWCQVLDLRAAAPTISPPAPDAADAPMLPGWVCRDGCGAFNGDAKEALTECRCCGKARPKSAKPPSYWFCETCHASLSGHPQTCPACGSP